MGIATVAVFSEADRRSLHVRYADEAYCIGPAPAIESYLDKEALLAVAQKSRAVAIHPGYGFLSENREFASACHRAGVVFVGPAPDVIEQMGNKTAARKIMIDHHIPVIPGSTDAVEDFAEAREICLEVGFPVMVKAASGGGGKGMRIVTCMEDLQESFQAVRREAYASFADSRIFVEKYFPVSRHVEVQVMADKQGNVIHLFERECSIQRRYQKVVEECPSAFVDDDLRKKLTSTAIQAAKAVNYSGAGTVEFLVDEEKNFYFLEMNTRIQVEHSVTELVTGTDLIKEQLRVAAGELLSYKQSEVVANGWAIECRLYAEDTENNYMPAPGLLKKITFPGGPGVRVDSGVYDGWEVSVYYDPMIAKISTWGRNREEARLRMLRALDECLVSGVKNNLQLHKDILADHRFIDGTLNTRFLESGFVEKKEPEPPTEHHLAILAAVSGRLLAGVEQRHDLPDQEDSGMWRMASKYQFWSSRF